MERLGEVPFLAICSNYAVPNDILLLFCNAEWESRGVIGFKSVEEAKITAERGYHGISQKWQESPYSNEDVENFLRDIYEVDPDAEWWKMTCSFCGKDDSEVGHMLAAERATICKDCAMEFYKYFRDEDNA